MIYIPIFFVIIGLVFVVERFINLVVVRIILILVFVFLSSMVSVDLGHKVAETNQLISFSRSLNDILFVIDKYKDSPERLEVIIKFLRDMSGNVYKLKNIELTMMKLNDLDRSFLEKAEYEKGKREAAKESSAEP
jgi:hypothetical protein